MRTEQKQHYTHTQREMKDWIINARFEVAMGKSQKQAFLQDIQDANSFFHMLGTIKSENSTTAIASDRANIAALMQAANVSFADLDRMLFDVLGD
ncbi:Aste57867_12442 [Aphanomyces stellatus]|uniref:Aste57867_12442 protein n=1 Tax=Aphanomyces stellatus TaxID=120398 RepID=A0A485KW66_9STRA|nr:hypothetical protein As57867_012396 [Aphanomyces stellatus]VFT89293.1 Aste57867_12442 [Aphanomyces stellatus]